MGCVMVRPQVSHSTIEEYKSRWDALETVAGTPDKRFKLLYNEVLKANAYLTTELEKERIINGN